MPDKRRPPKPRAGPRRSIKAADAPETDYNASTPKFCLRHLHNGHCLTGMPTEKQAAFALALQDRATMTWTEITLAGRHGHGSELIPKEQIKPEIPPAFEDRSKFLVLRYSGNLPMVGVRKDDVFHILWIEQDFGDVYDHGD